ncbi:hypothetical protein [Burkholderia territorii]|uniref:hypothetical protein n=1 Tax=Burkholderia territorii TaxID=1503055 RepID=UPI000A5DCA19|nr:hypothetical protein [Burkholderia territorii]
MAQQLIARIGSLGSSVFPRVAPAAMVTAFPLVMHCGAGAFRMIASQQNSCRDRAAPVAPAPDVALMSLGRHRMFSGRKYRCKKPTLQLSSYVVAARVFHMMRRRFTQVFVASKALNHLQLSLTIARIC